MSLFARESKEKPRRRFAIFDIIKKLVAVIIIIAAIAVIIFSIPGMRVLKVYFPPIF